MKTVTIRELHTRTGELVREATRFGVILISHHGKVIAKITPEAEPAEVPYFARRKYISESARRLIERGNTGGGTDSTQAISEEREDRV